MDFIFEVSYALCEGLAHLLSETKMKKCTAVATCMSSWLGWGHYSMTSI